MSEEEATTTRYSSMSRTLYVVLQGEFMLYHEVRPGQNDALRILAPDIRGHTYLAGPWLTDWTKARKLPKSLSLDNVFGDQKQSSGKHCLRCTPEGNLDIIPTLGKLQPSQPGSFQPIKPRVDITAPMPLAILPGLIETTESVQIEVENKDGSYSYPPVPSTATVIPILVYKWYEGNPPFLFDTQAEKVWCYSGGPNDSGGYKDPFQSLQVYATDPTELGETNEQHARDAFTSAAAVLGVQATVTWKDYRGGPIFATPLAGLSFAQVNWFLYEIVNHAGDKRKLLQDYIPLTRPLGGGGPHNCGPGTVG